MLIRLRPKDILYFESSRRKVLLHAVDAIYTLRRRKYQDVREQFKALGFIDTHRFYMVNIAHIKAVTKQQDVLLDNGERILLSRRLHDQVVEHFMSAMRG